MHYIGGTMFNYLKVILLAFILTSTQSWGQDVECEKIGVPPVLDATHMKLSRQIANSRYSFHTEDLIKVCRLFSASNAYDSAVLHMKKMAKKKGISFQTLLKDYIHEFDCLGANLLTGALHYNAQNVLNLLDLGIDTNVIIKGEKGQEVTLYTYVLQQHKLGDNPDLWLYLRGQLRKRGARPCNKLKVNKCKM